MLRFGDKVRASGEAIGYRSFNEKQKFSIRILEKKLFLQTKIKYMGSIKHSLYIQIYQLSPSNVLNEIVIILKKIDNNYLMFLK